MMPPENPFLQSASSEQKSIYDILKDFGVPIGAIVFTVAAAFFGHGIPVWLTVIIRLYVTGVVIIILLFLNKWLCPLQRIRASAQGKTLYPRLEKAISDFGTFLDTGGIGDLPHPLSDISRLNALRGLQPFHDSVQLRIMEDWYSEIKCHLSFYSAKNILPLTLEFGKLTLRRHDFFEQLRKDLQSLIDGKPLRRLGQEIGIAEKLGRDDIRSLKVTWEVFRTGYNAKSNEWWALAKDIRESLGGMLGHFDLVLIPLESPEPNNAGPAKEQATK